MTRIGVFCGSSAGNRPAFRQAAADLAGALARRGFGLVYGGARVGLMDGFIALPGGYGTLEEFCEVLTWAQLGLHRKPCGLLGVGAYFDPLLARFDEAVAAGFLRPENRAMVLRANDLEALLDQFASY